MFCRFSKLFAWLALFAVACGITPSPSDADAGAHLYGAATPFAYPVVPANGSIGDLCSVGGSTAPAGCGIRTTPIATNNPAQSNVPVYDSTPGHYSVRQLTADDIAAGFTINAFTGGSTVEVGATVTNPAFTASYSSTPLSAQITNTDGIDSPLVLSTPFTSGTVVGSFTHSSVATVTFTLTAVSTSTQTRTSSISYLARTFSGLATAGATGATASGTTAVLVGATGTLTGSSPDGGLFSSIVGQSFGPFSPSGQKIDVLTPHTSSAHVFDDQNGFIFPMLTPTTFSFTNVNSAVISYDLYESTNLLSTIFTLTTKS